MLKRHAVSAAAGAILALATPVQADSHVTADTVVATVNGTEITLGHMIVLKQRLPAQYQSLPPAILFEGILDQLVQQTVLGETGAELSPGSVKRLENEERALKAAEVIREIAQEATTDEAIQAAYDASFGEAAPETEYNAAHILVETEDEAKAIIEELGAGADFEALARERSTGPSGPNGGQLGWFSAGQMVQPFEEAVLAMEPGTVSDPVQTQFGWHVIRLNETRQKAVPTLDEVRAQLVEQVQQDVLEARLDELTENAEITRMTTEEIDPVLLDDLSLLGE